MARLPRLCLPGIALHVSQWNQSTPNISRTEAWQIAIRSRWLKITTIIPTLILN